MWTTHNERTNQQKKRNRSERTYVANACKIYRFIDANGVIKTHRAEFREWHHHSAHARYTQHAPASIDRRRAREFDRRHILQRNIFAYLPVLFFCCCWLVNVITHCKRKQVLFKQLVRRNKQAHMSEMLQHNARVSFTCADQRGQCTTTQHYSASRAFDVCRETMRIIVEPT